MLKQYIEVPIQVKSRLFTKILLRIIGSLLSPFYLGMAYLSGAKGISFHVHCVAMGARLLFAGHTSLKTCYSLLFFPMDSTRYLEFHEVLNKTKGYAFTRYLDVSSPRLMPLYLMKTRPEATAVLINPDADDLQTTQELAESLNVKYNCEFLNTIIGADGLSPNSFDLITCLSVLEHIPEGTDALETMWSLLSPGGKLILTLPCMSKPLEQYISHNQYGVLNPGDDGYTFWQRYYDSEHLKATVYSVTGTPNYTSIYGEKKLGLFFRNATMKRLLGALYPFWREPYMMATEYKQFDSLDELPGEGVIMLEFIKK